MKNRSTDIVFSDSLALSALEVLKLIFTNTEEMLMLVDRELRIISTNESAQNSIYKNLSVYAKPGDSVLMLVPPEKQQELTKLYAKVLCGEEHRFETIIEKKEGSVYFESLFKPARNQAGEIVAVLVSTKDISKRKEEQAILKQIEERWRFALEGGNQGVWDWNVQTGDIFFSDSYKKLYGYDECDLKGKIEEWETMIHPEDKEKMSGAIKEHLSTEDPYYESTYRVKTKEGNYKWVLGRGMLIRNEEGTPVRMIGTHTDITKQVTAEQTYKVLFHSNPLPMWTYDLDTLRFLTVNDAAVQHYGYSREEFLSQTIKDIWPKEDVERLIKVVLNRRNLSHVKRMSRHLKKNGEIISVEITTHLLNDSNTVLVVAQDITERQYAERTLSLERSVLELSNQPGIDFKHLAATLLSGLEKIHSDAYTSLVLLKDDDTIEPITAPRLPEAYSNLLRGLKIGPQEGAWGASMWKKQTVIAEDINTDPLWEKYRSLALQFGLQSCWSLPIIHTSGNVMGAFVIYYQKRKRPTETELNTLERIKNIIRILMEHHRSLDEIKKANERFDIVIRATHDLIWDWDLETDIIYRDVTGLQKVYGITDNKSIERIEQWLLHIHPDDIEKVQNTVAGILLAKQQDTFDVEYRFKKGDGTYSYVYDRGMIIRNEEGKPVRMIGAAQDISERKLLEEELLRTELGKQKAINQATVDSQEQERTEIGKELHDNVNQILTTTKLYLDLALSNSDLKDELIAKSSKNIISVINEIRQLSRSLMDPTIGDLGLIDSINDLIENINLTRQLHVFLSADNDVESRLDKSHKLTIFRIIQEALNNAIKYAKATTVEIIFKLYDNNMMVAIKDDGIGFDPSSVRLGAGLKNIQNRVYLINGAYTIQAAPQKGCKIIINFPIN